MENKALHTLAIDREFQNLIYPLERKEYAQIEAELLVDGCLEPITVWNGCIIDGYDRYDVCIKHMLPFSVSSMKFDCREAVIAWICANQLGRCNIPAEMRKFLIGMQFESERQRYSLHNSQKKVKCEDMGNKSVCERNKAGEEGNPHLSGYSIALGIAQNNKIASGTVLKYAGYSRFLEDVRQKAPEFVLKILAGRYKISYENLAVLSKLTGEEIEQAERRLQRRRQPLAQHGKTRQELWLAESETYLAKELKAPSIKDMPAFDPDADITALTLTMPSWVSSMRRTQSNTDFSQASDHAKAQLGEALAELSFSLLQMLHVIKEGE